MSRIVVSLAAALVLCGVGGASPPTASAQQADILAAIDGAARRWGLTPRFLRCLAACESAFRPGVTSRAGAMGLYQFTARTLQANAPRYGFRGHSPYEARARGARGGRDDRQRPGEALAAGPELRIATGVTPTDPRPIRMPACGAATPPGPSRGRRGAVGGSGCCGGELCMSV